MGWWPQLQPPGPAFYAYTYPEPEGYRTVPIQPPQAAFDQELGLFMLPYDAVPAFRIQTAPCLPSWSRPTPPEPIWPRGIAAALEPAERPGRPPRRPWSVRR